MTTIKIVQSKRHLSLCRFHTASPIDMGTDDNKRDEREVLEPAVHGKLIIPCVIICPSAI